MLNFIFVLCAFFATLALIAIALEVKNTRSAIEDLTTIFDEMNRNIRDLNDSKK
jgi:predicted PurR-regulated permease PerM